MRNFVVFFFQAALLLLPDTFNLEQFFSQIVSLSYHGDFRMFFGEDKKKIEKIVKGSSQHLHDIYVPILESDSRTLVRGFRVEQVGCSPFFCPFSFLHMFRLCASFLSWMTSVLLCYFLPSMPSKRMRTAFSYLWVWGLHSLFVADEGDSIHCWLVSPALT